MIPIASGFRCSCYNGTSKIDFTTRQNRRVRKLNDCRLTRRISCRLGAQNIYSHKKRTNPRICVIPAANWLWSRRMYTNGINGRRVNTLVPNRITSTHRTSQRKLISNTEFLPVTTVSYASLSYSFRGNRAIFEQPGAPRPARLLPLQSPWTLSSVPIPGSERNYFYHRYPRKLIANCGVRDVRIIF